MYSSSSLTRLSAAACGGRTITCQHEEPRTEEGFVLSGTDSDVLIGGLSAVEVVLSEELGQLGLDAAQRLVLAVKQHHQV